MQLSVVILNYNVRYFLEVCLYSVQKALEGLDAEIIVVDNASKDGSAKMIRKKFPEVIFVENSENVGFPRGNNQGVALAKGEYVCILNPDTIVSKDTFVKLLDFAESKFNLGIVGCKLIDGTGKFLPESKRGIPTPWVALTKILGLYQWFPTSKSFNQYYAMHVKENQTHPVDVLVGAFMLMKRSLYQKMGGFDEKCFMYSDDIDLSYRVLQKGYENYYMPSTLVIHFKGESTVKDRNYVMRFQEAMGYFYQKHFKQFFFFGFIMKMIGWVFSIFKWWKSKQKPFVPELHMLITNNEMLAKKMKNRMQLCFDVRNLQNFDMANYSKQKVLCWIDLEHEDTCKIITFMHQNQHANLKYRLIEPNQQFVIGSDSKDNLGETILLS
ncbi:MAG: glycosyltransferase family 2 protein [Flavobacteriales bacterium]|nr:glycosyltransferase family 2 protein [Flavobacteriales bacterium]